MATELSTVQYIVDQAGLGQRLQSRKMFGEYALYVDGKVVALVCDNQLFLKPTAEGRARLGSVVEAPPYPGAKNHFLLAGELDDPELLREALHITATVLPEPRLKGKAVPKAKVAPKGKAAPKAKAVPKSKATPKAGATVADYLSALTVPQRKALKSVLALVRKTVPGAALVISYGIPAFRKDRVFVYCAAFKRHIGIYPPVRKDAALIKVLRPYANAKGNLAFSLDVPLPLKLIARVARALDKEYAESAAPRRKSRAAK